MSDVLMVASEASPFYKAGGLGDVVGSLAAALVEQGREVDVVVPLYEKVWPDRADKVSEFEVTAGQSGYQVSVLALRHRGVRYLFLQIPRLFDRRGIYGQEDGDYRDNATRFGVFCWATFELVARRISQPRVVHCHDWQTGLVPLLLKTRADRAPSIAHVKTVFTVHDLVYQGRFDKFVLPELGLDWSLFNPEQLEFWGDVSFLKGGLVFSDRLTTVSPSHAKNVQNPERGCGLEGVLRSRAAQLVGVLNGIDYTCWNPSQDAHLVQTYSFTDLTGKAACKEDLLHSFWFAGDLLLPTFGVVSRFAEREEVELIESVTDVLLAANARLIIHASCSPDLEGDITKLAKAFPQNIGVVLGVNDILAHKIHAGADMLLIPHRYEPCGFSQFKALRYGTIPVVRAIGGADDSVTEEYGFKFTEYTAQALAQSVREACAAYHERPYHWRRMMIRAMQQDFSWERCAREYSQLYAELQS